MKNAREAAFCAALALLALALPAGAAEPPADAGAGAESLRLGLPIRCRPGTDCWIVNLVDLDPGPGWRDYACGVRTYDGHKGTDIAVRDLKAMQAGVPVLAAARGRVKATRDGMKDVDVSLAGPGSVAGRECGNGVVVDHGGGWETQYCHLRRGSVGVRKDDPVDGGQRLGLVGNSGRADFPHVHLTVRLNGEVIDPFVGPARTRPCTAGRGTLWHPDTFRVLSREWTAVHNAGFATGPVEPRAARRGILDARRLPATAAALVLWADVFWVEAGDLLRLRVTGPDGAIIVDHPVEIEKTQARRFAFAGRERKSARLPAGTAPAA